MMEANEMTAEQVRTRVLRVQEQIRQAMETYRSPSEHVTLMAVTKTVSPELVNAAISCGISTIGENRVQEYLSKREAYDPSAEVHFIGHLQTNKVRQVVGAVSMIHSVDSLRLASAIHSAAETLGICQDILLEINIGNEPTKNGILPDALFSLYDQIEETCPAVRIRGLMTIPPPEQHCDSFAAMQELYESLRIRCGKSWLDTLSMGMSSDFEDAIRYGSTIVRVGSGLFGPRQYPNPFPVI